MSQILPILLYRKTNMNLTPYIIILISKIKVTFKFSLHMKIIHGKFHVLQIVEEQILTNIIIIRMYHNKHNNNTYVSLHLI